MRIFSFISLPALIAALVAAVNVFTEITKRVVKVKTPEHVVVLWAVVLSEGACFAAITLQSWLSVWACLGALAAGALLGLLVAYAAMYGYDELYADALGVIERLIGYLTGRERHDQQQEP